MHALYDWRVERKSNKTRTRRDIFNMVHTHIAPRSGHFGNSLVFFVSRECRQKSLFWDWMVFVQFVYSTIRSLRSEPSIILWHNIKFFLHDFSLFVWLGNVYTEIWHAWFRYQKHQNKKKSKKDSKKLQTFAHLWKQTGVGGASAFSPYYYE